MRAVLEAQPGHSYAGLDEQVDTYFSVPEGRLKLRQGSIENSLIRYHRSSNATARLSQVQLTLLQPEQAASLLTTLQSVLPVRVVVRKQRHIYWLGHAKIHLDSVAGLGDYVEVEIVDYTNSQSLPDMEAQALALQQLLGIRPQHFVGESYSDLLLAQQATGHHRA